MVYQWKDGSRLTRLDAQVIGERIEGIRSLHGSVTASAVVADARAANSPLHPAFEWNNKVAAERYRLEQARHLLRHITVTFAPTDGSTERTIRAFVTVPDASEDGADVYQSTEVAMSDPDMRRHVVERARRELDSWKRRYRDISELADIFAALESAESTAAA